MVTKIIVNLELGHVAKTLDVPTLNGHTHEWMVFVNGADGMAIEHFVEKVVFWLHDTYVPPKCVVKQPPYQVKQSGYAGFNILIDIHFKNKSEPKSVRFHYDLFLHKENMPPVNHTRVEMLTFTNPAEDFKKRLVKAGGIVKTQEAPPKERKPPKDVRHSEEKQGRPSKEKYESDKARQKVHRIDMKPSKPSVNTEDKRRSSVSEEIVKKKKHEDKPPAPSSHPSSDSKSKEKDKISKLKIVVEPSSSMASLFPIEDSINIKQIKKKEAAGADSKKEKRLEPKKKKEISMKQEYSEKKIRKQSPIVQKVKPSKEAKIKRPRTVSSSDESDIIRKSSAILTRSDSDSEIEVKKMKKHSKLDKMKLKKTIKRSKNTPEKVIKQASTSRISNKGDNVVPEVDLRKPPLNVEQVAIKKTKKHRKLSESGYDKKAKAASVSEKSKSSASSAKLHVKHVPRSSTPTAKKEKHKTIHSSLPTTPVESISRERKISPLPQHRSTKEERFHSTSESSNSSSDDEVEAPSPIKDVPKPMIPPPSPMSSSASDSPSSEIPSFNLHQEEPDDPMSASNEDLHSAATDSHMNDSESEQASFTQEGPPDQLDTSLDTSGEGKSFVESDYKEPCNERSAVMVGVGETLNYYPHMDDQLFEQLQQVQAMLARVTDETCIRKISSIVRKAGNFRNDGEMMDIDLCSLDKKTIHRLEKHLKVAVDK